MSNSNARYNFDSAKFIERLKLVIGDTPVRRFSRSVGISDTLIRNYLSGSMPSVEKAADIAKGAGVDFSWLCFGLGEPPAFITTGSSPARTISESAPGYAATAPAESDDIVWINSYDVFASAGNGFINEHETGSKLPFSYAWLAENGLTGKHLSLLRVSGDSMYPTLRDKEIPLVEMLPDDFISRLVDDVYVIRLNGQLLVKRIQRYGNNGFLIKSDNSFYESFQLTQENWPDDFKVIARWTGKKF